MPNSFVTEPQLSPSFPKKVRMWTCPITGLEIPKDPDANLQWRAALLEAAENDADLQQDLFTACSKSILFFVNAFCFTLRVFEPGADGEVQQAVYTHLPFVTWEIQDNHLTWLEQRVEDGEEGLTDKSRDMGATWDHIALYVHRFLFAEHETHLMMSRKEDAVDQLDGLPKNYPHGSIADPGTLFGKVDYVLSRLPEWMLPRMNRKKMHLVNLDNATRIDGESANATAGSSDRRTSIFLDEFAKVDEAESIKRSTKDVTACRLVCSTPNGAGTTYSKWRLSGTIDVFVLPWWEHPEKGLGRYTKIDSLDRFQIRSPWYDVEATKRTPKEMAIEIDMDHIGSGDTFFESSIIEQHKKLFAKPPRVRMTIQFKKGVPEDTIPDVIRKCELSKVLAVADKGAWKIWCNLIEGRPDQNKTYTFGIDISKGQGASNSVISAMCNETREKVAEFADAETPPGDLARIACAAAIWFGGRNRRPLIVFENNGDPGYDFGNQLVKNYSYSNIYFDKQVGTMREKRGKRFGWRSNTEKKAIALGILRRAYAHGRIINHSEAALNECLTYISYENGGIGPAELVEEADAARKTHGDRVIADTMMLIGLADTGKMKAAVTANPQRSIGHRLAEFRRDKKKRERGNTFNFNEAA